MRERRVLFISTRRRQPEPWRAEWGELSVVDGAAAVEQVAAVADVALIDGEDRDPFEVVRQLHESDAAVQPIVLARGDDRPRLQRALLFARGVGETWIEVERELSEPLLEQATSITRKRRRFRETRGRITDPIAHPPREPKPFRTDAYLAALLQVLPDPALALDDEQRVLFWSPSAERVLGVSAASADGRPFPELVRSDAAAWRQLFELAAQAPAEGELHYASASGEERIAIVGLAPIQLGQQHARVVLLHDITAERASHQRLVEQAELLEQQTTELEAQAEELQRYAAEKDALLAERDETLERLERAMEVRSRFYANMNHEIRTPINAILGYTDLLLSGAYGELPAQQQRALAQSQRAASHLVEIVNDLLDLSKLEAGRMELQLEGVRLQQLIDDLLATMQPLAAEHETTLVAHLDDCGSIITDPRRVRQILLNLVSNAVKFGEKRPVELHCGARQDESVWIEVIDHGIGIAPSDLPRIFEEFVQVGRKRTAGTGLGLSISRQLAQLLGGRLTVRSEPGRGSAFRLELPRRTGTGNG